MTSNRGEFRQGWTVVLAASLGIAFGISPVPFNVLGYLTPSLQSEFHWSRAAIMSGIAIVGVTNSLMTPVYGWLIDRHGVRKVALLSLASYGFVWASIAVTPGSIIAFYGQWFLMGLVGSASQPISWTRAVVAWFEHRRGFALGITLTGTGIASVVLNSLAPVLVSAFGWRAAVIGTALLPLCVALPLAWAFFRDPPIPVGLTPMTLQAAGVSVRQALHSWRFWLMASAFCGIALAYVGLFANYSLLLIDHGFALERAGVAISVVGVSIVLGRLVGGLLFDRYWAPLVAAPLIASPVITCWLLSGNQISTFEAVAGAAMLGFAAGVEGDLMSYLVARYFGLRHYGTLYGILFGLFGLGASASPALYAAVHDRFDTYNPALWGAAAVFILSALSLLLLGPYPEIIRRQVSEVSSR